jgi:hypothetical protein
LIVFSTSFDRTFVVRVKSYAPTSLGAQAFSFLGVGIGGARGRGFGEKECEEFVGNGEMGGLLELLKRNKSK